MDPSKTPALHADYGQTLLGGEVIAAFHDAGIVPPDIYTAPGWCMRFDRGSMVTLEVSLIVPFDRLRMGLEIIEQKRQEGGNVHDR